MLHLRRFARPSTLALAVLLGMQGGAWAQQPMEEAAAPSASASAKAPLPLEELRTFAAVLDSIKAASVEPVDDKTLLENAIKGMISNLDPHSAYLEHEAFAELQENTKNGRASVRDRGCHYVKILVVTVPIQKKD